MKTCCPNCKSSYVPVSDFFPNTAGTACPKCGGILNDWIYPTSRMSLDVQKKRIQEWGLDLNDYVIIDGSYRHKSVAKKSLKK